MFALPLNAGGCSGLFILPRSCHGVPLSAGNWDRTLKWSGRLRVVEQGEQCVIRLEETGDKGTDGRYTRLVLSCH